MKSLLQEANTIERALDKAWNQAGKPKEFTIKILDEGERNFLGLTRRPAIVSIIYKPEKLTATPMVSRNNKEDRSSEKHERRERATQAVRNNQEASRRQDGNGRRYAGTEEQRNAFTRDKNVEGWRSEWKDFVLSEIEALLGHMGISAKMQAQTSSDKVLTVSFDRAILDNDEDQRMLFATLSYLSIQLLKRNYKSRFVGYRVVVTGPKADGSSMSADSEESLPRASFEQRSSGRGQQQSHSGQQQRSRESGEQSGTQNGDSKQRERGGQRERRDDRGDRRSSRRERAPQQQAQPREHGAPLPQDGHHDDIAADQARFAQQQLSRDDKKATPLKKEAKYQPFFVLEDEEGGKQ